MKRFNRVMLGLLLLGIPLFMAGQAQAQFSGLGLNAEGAVDQINNPRNAINTGDFGNFGNARAMNAEQAPLENAPDFDPEEVFEDNPDRFDEAAEEGKTIVPDISALGLGRENAAAGKEVRIENRRAKAKAADFAREPRRAKANRERAANAEKADREKAMEFGSMVGNEKFGADVHGVLPAEKPMHVDAGKAALDKENNFSVEMKGLRFQEDGMPAAGMKMKAGIACLDSGAFMARGKEEEVDQFDNSGEGSFQADEQGNARFDGRMDFAGASCIAPTPMVTDEQGKFLAVGAHGADEEADDADNSGKGNAEDEDFHDEEFDDADVDKDAEKAAKDAEKAAEKAAKDADNEKLAKDFEKADEKAAKNDEAKDIDAAKEFAHAEKDADNEKVARAEADAKENAAMDENNEKADEKGDKADKAGDFENRAGNFKNEARKDRE